MPPSIKTIQAQVYNFLKQNICDGVYTPGQRLLETELAASLSVSRSPVREAMRKLASEGLVEEFPNRGVFVKQFSDEDIDHIFDVRILLESHAIRHSQRNLTEEKAKALRARLDAMTRVYRAGSLEEYIEQDTELHKEIIELADNPVLTEMYELVYSRVQQFRIYSLISKQRFDESIEEHSTVVESILNGDTAVAVRTNKLHLKLARGKIIEHLAAQRAKDKEEQQHNA